ncbi:MAG: ATP-binding protein [Thermodesulfovibrionales bacterium]
MFNPLTVITVSCLYIGFLFLIALWVEKKASKGINIGNHPLIYSLSLAVYCTSWTFYGSVGKAATSGMLFLAIYLGPTLAIILWWTMIRKIIRVKNTYRITSIADFISARYNKSQGIAALATIIALAGIVPYVALQLKAIISTFEIITTPLSTKIVPGSSLYVGLLIVALMTIFTIMFGVRRLDPTERHQGMVVALAAECLVKLVAFLASGIFVTYFLFNGFDDIFQRLSVSPFNKVFEPEATGNSFYLTWTTYLILAMFAIMFLPRQFHITIVENFDEKHIKTAMWVFPLYMLLINIFVLPIAKGGLLLGYPIHEADTFVLGIPFYSGQQFLSLLVFIGGLSAATGMIMISSMTMATMMTNHLLLPVIEHVGWLGFLRRYLLECRWVAVAVYILAGYIFEQTVGESFMLVNLGMISFAAVLQFAPVILGGIFWKQGNRVGAFLGLSAGFMIWFYTLVIPAIVKAGWITESLIKNGPWGMNLLKPEQFFGLTGLDPLSHALFWTMLFNIGLYVIGSLYFEKSKEEQSLTEEFMNILATGIIPTPIVSGESFINLSDKKAAILKLLHQYFPYTKSQEILEQCLITLRLSEKEQISIVELIELLKEIEKFLTGSIGAAAAHHTIRNSDIFTPVEEGELSKVYAEILADLKLSPSELKEKIDYYKEREQLLGKKYQTLVENVNIGIYRKTGGPHGSFFQANPAIARMFGYDSVEEFLKVQTSSLYQDPRDRIKFMEKIKKQGYVKDELLKLRKKNGTPIWGSITAKVQYDEYGEIKWIDGVIEDITKRKLSEERLVQSLEALQSVYNIATTMRGSYEAVCDQVVYNLSSLLRISYVAVQHIEEDQMKIISRITDGKFTHNEISYLEHSPCAMVCEKRKPCQIKGSLQQIFPEDKFLSYYNFKTHIGVPIKNISGKVVGSLCAMDYEDRILSEDEIRLIEIFARYVAYEYERNIMETQLRQLEKMKLLGQMAAGVAHEVRNPLNAILAITEALFQDIGDNPEYKPFLDHIRTQVDRLSRLMGDLLDLGKPIQPSSLHQEFIPSICTATMDLWKQIPLSKTHRVRLVLLGHNSNLTVMADSSRLQQVFLNLLENAAQHSPEGSEIQIIVSNPKGITVRIHIVDQGTGLPAENFQKVFEPFFTTRKRGNGLGLSLAKNTILAHGGNIGIKNNDPPPGCTIEISLPVLQEVEL